MTSLCAVLLLATLSGAAGMDEIRGAARRFRAKVGVDAAYRRGKADFVVRTNGVEALHTPPLAAGDPPRAVEVPLAGVRRVELAVRRRQERVWH